MINVFRKYADKPMSYGDYDCCQFVGECLEQTLGYNPARQFVYDSEAGAQQHIDRFGSLEALITSLFGKPYYGYEHGFVGVVNNGGRQVAGIIYRDRIVCRTEKGVMDLPVSRASKVWKPWVS
jgi:hypothetical protein